jgi:hypothetical protein
MTDQHLSAALDAELVALRDITSPVDRAYLATQLHDVCARGVSAIAAVRVQALCELREAGWSLSRIARTFGISRARVAQLTCSNDSTDAQGVNTDESGGSLPSQS